MEDDGIVTKAVCLWQSTWHALRAASPNISETIDGIVRRELGLATVKHPRPGVYDRTRFKRVDGKGRKRPVKAVSVPVDAIRALENPTPAVPPIDGRSCGHCGGSIPTGAEWYEDGDGRAYCAKCATTIGG